MAIAWWIFGPRESEIDHRSNWVAFNNEYVSRYVTIPPEAKIIEATECRDLILGGGIKVVFTLPNSKTPEEWMLQLTTGEGVALRDYKLNDFHYDASGHGWDVYWLRYYPDAKHYVFRYHWD